MDNNTPQASGRKPAGNKAIGRLPRAVAAIIGTGRAGCHRCHGDGVVVVACISGAAFRPCGCVAPQPRRASRPMLVRV
jgi:hypothetical protein